MRKLLFTPRIQAMSWAVAALTVLVACRQPVEASEANAAPLPAPPAGPAEAAAPTPAAVGIGTAAIAGGGAETPLQAAEAPPARQYTVQATAVQLKPGANQVATVTIRPVKGMKFNKEFPAKFTVEAAPFARSTKDKLTMKDGDVKVAGTDGVLSIPLTGVAAGAGTLKVVGNFSICNEEQCYMLRNEQLSLEVTVR